MKSAVMVMVQGVVLAMVGCASQPKQPTSQPMSGTTVVADKRTATDKRAAGDKRATGRGDAAKAKRAAKKPGASKAVEKGARSVAEKPKPSSGAGKTFKPADGEKASPAIQPSAKSEEEGALVLVPSQGRPVMLMPGDTLYFVMRLRKDLGKKILVWLVHSHVPELRYGVRADVKLSIVNDRYGQMILKVPRGAAPGLYDLEVQGENRSYFSRHSVKIVQQWTDRFRFVHLSNMNVDDPAAPEFDNMLADEVNLLAPEFVVCTGDLTQWGRAQKDPTTWKRVLEFLSKINAPTYVVCGDHDHEKSFGRYVADNPIGTFDFGNYHGILMLDHSAHRLDDEQLKWLKTELANHRNPRGFNFIIMHNDELDVLDMLRREVKDLPQYVRAHKLRMVITGGHVDWNRREFLDKLESLQGPNGLVYVRTHQSSTAMHSGASGVSHYRVVEVDGQRINHVYPDDNSAKRADHSIPVGRLRVFHAGPNNGTRGVVIATVQNALNQKFDNCRVWLRVAKSPGSKPAVVGGELVRVLDGRTYWMCEVKVDLPDKGGVKVMAASTASRLPEAPPVRVQLTNGRATTSRSTTEPAVRKLAFKEQQADSGISFFRATRNLSLLLTNTSSSPQEVWPVVRLNGEMIALDWESTSSDRKPLKLPAGKSATLPLKLVLGRVSEGEHSLQVFFRSDPLRRLTRFPMILEKVAK